MDKKILGKNITVNNKIMGKKIMDPGNHGKPSLRLCTPGAHLLSDVIH